MKKYILLSLVFIFILPKITFGDFISEPTGLDLYKKIDSWIYDLEVKYLDKELKWWNVSKSIIDNLKKLAKEAWLDESCINWNPTTKDIQNIYNDNDSVSILNELLKNCYDKDDNSISTQTFNNYLKLINNVYLESSNKAQKKVDNIYKIWRIWMYSDWIDENSPFDLMSDIKDIDSIIFDEKIPYNWVNNDIWRDVRAALSWLNSLNNSKIVSDANKTVCVSNDFDINSVFWTNTWSTSTWNTLQNTWYSKVNDNNAWPCNNFFCIVIKFVTYSHKVLWWSNLSIEWLLKRSNDHLKKFSATSWIQAKMTINHFEIWLKDLNLPDIFHVWIQVSYKPVPLLDLDTPKNKKQDDDDFKSKNLLIRYYRNLWLDYERANDLNILKKKEPELKSLLDSTELWQNEVTNKMGNYNNIIEKIKKENEFVSQTVIDKKILADEVEDFYHNFLELESFSRAFMDYTLWVSWVVWKMNQIPQTWKN